MFSMRQISFGFPLAAGFEAGRVAQKVHRNERHRIGRGLHGKRARPDLHSLDELGRGPATQAEPTASSARAAGRRRRRRREPHPKRRARRRRSLRARRKSLLTGRSSESSRSASGKRRYSTRCAEPGPARSRKALFDLKEILSVLCYRDRIGRRLVGIIADAPSASSVSASFRSIVTFYHINSTQMAKSIPPLPHANIGFNADRLTRSKFGAATRCPEST